MPVGANTRVYVLGAGCSYHEQHGYPLAKSFATEPSAYATKIVNDSDCRRIKEAVDATMKLLAACQSGSCHAATIDQLINLVLNGICDDRLKALKAPQIGNVANMRYDAVRSAKIATSACFLDKEADVMSHQISKYKDSIQGRVLNGTGVSSRL